MRAPSPLAAGLLLFLTLRATAGEFDAPQSPPRPAPFPVTLVDQGKFDPRLKGLLAPDGFKTEIVADAPTVINPVGLTFAPDGTLFVAEWAVDPVTGKNWYEFKETFRYRDGTSRQVATMRKFVPDPIKVLTRDPATGTYTRATPVISEELPSTLLWHDGYLYTASRGSVRRYKQSRKNGPWDIRETVAQGFCGFHHHQVSGLSIGLDGKLYITTGDDDNDGEGSDGSRATVLRTGAIFRCDPDGSHLEEFSRGYRNPYRDLCHDAAYNWFHADNDNEDGSKFTGCRLVHVAEGVDYGWRLRDGARCCKPDFGRGAVGGEKPGKLPPMLKTGRGSPAGLLAYHDTRLPERYRGLLYYPDVFRKLVRAYKVTPTGASFAVSHEFEFLKSDDPLFRPCQMVTGPDGAVYVVDWRTDSGGAGRLSGDGTHGRIYRLTWVGTKDEPALAPRGLDSWKLLLAYPDNALVLALDRPDLTDRVEARKELVRRGESAHAATLRAFTSGSLRADGRLAALGVLQARWSPDVADLFRLLLNDASADVRRLAADAFGTHSDRADRRTRDALARLLTDEAPAARRAAALALGRQQADGTAGMLAAAWQADDGRDPFLGDAYLRGLEHLGKPGIDAVLVLARSGDDHGRAKAVAAFAAFRERVGLDALPSLVSDPHLTPDQRAELVRSATNYQLQPAASFDPLLAALPADAPPAVRAAMLDVLAVGPVKGTGERFVLACLAHPDGAVRLSALRAVDEQRLVAAAGPLTALIADASRSAGERAALLRSLRAVAGPPAVPTLVAVLNRPEPAAVQVEALRTLSAASPATAREIALTLLTRPDPTVVAEAVSVAGATREGAMTVADRYLAGKLSRDLLPRITDSLNRFRSDPAAASLSGRLLMGGLTLATDKATTADIIEQVAKRGDPLRGKAVYLNTNLVACATCHKLEGVGGSVGPDLTRVWDTQSLPKLIESIADPSKEIKEGYQAYRASMADGRVLTGLRVTDDAQTVLLRDAEGRDLRLPKADLEALTVSRQSLMPADVVNRLSYDQFLDLLAFLKSRPEQESLRGTVTEAQLADGYPPSLLTPEPPEKGGGGWHKLLADAAGRLDVRAATATGPTAGYLRAFAFSPTPQQVTLDVASDGPVRAWAGGKLVVDRPAPTAGERVAVELPAGWTPVLVKTVTDNPKARLTVRVQGTGVRTAASPE